jgi:two-component system alkaline phosphatase synthesis response regulator PhoP
MNNILVINNDNDTMSLLKLWLERRSYNVKYTSNGDNIPQLIKEFEPNVVLVDVLQKDAAEEIKKNKEINDVPVILMTGYTLRQTPLEVMVDDIIEKPFNLKILEKKIERLIDKGS